MNHKKLLLCVVIKYMFFVCGVQPMDLSMSMNPDQLNAAFSASTIFQGGNMPEKTGDLGVSTHFGTNVEIPNDPNYEKILALIDSIQKKATSYHNNFDDLETTKKQLYNTKITGLIENLKNSISADPSSTGQRTEILDGIISGQISKKEHLEHLAYNINLVKFITVEKQGSLTSLDASAIALNTLVSDGQMWPKDIPSQIKYIKQLPIHDDFKIYFFQLMWLENAKQISNRNKKTLLKLKKESRLLCQLINNSLQEYGGKLPSISLDKEGTSKFLLIFSSKEEIKCELDSSQQPAFQQFLATVQEWYANYEQLSLRKILKKTKDEVIIDNIISLAAESTISDALKIYNENYLMAYVASKTAKYLEENPEALYDDINAGVPLVVEKIVAQGFISSNPSDKPVLPLPEKQIHQQKGLLGAIKRSLSWFLSFFIKS